MTRPEPSTPKGKTTRSHLIDVAAQAFAERGFTATKFSDLIAASGLTKGAFYFYFPSKAALAAAVIEEQDRRWVGQIRERVLTQPTPQSQLADLIPAMTELLTQDPGAWSVVRLVRELGEDSAVEAPVAKPLDNWLSLISGIIRDGQATGDFRDDLDADVLATVLVGAFDGIKALVDSTGSDLTAAMRVERLRPHAQTLGNLALTGLTPPPR